MGNEEPGVGEALKIAQAFVAARRDARGLPEYPGVVPETLAQGYAVQHNAITLWGEPVAGWKVGRIPPPADTRLGANRLVGAIFPDAVVPAEPIQAMPIFAEGFGAAEAEFLLRIGSTPDPSKTSFTIDEAMTHIDAVHVGIEIASSPFPGINALGPTVTVTDFGNNNGLIVGAPVPDWQSRAFEDWTIRLDIDGVEQGRAKARDMLDGPFGAAAFLFSWAAANDVALTPGQWISSGAVTGVHQIGVGQASTAWFGDDLQLSCTIVAATPTR